jgi:hypothetical protein
MSGRRRSSPDPIPDDWSAAQACAVADFCQQLNYAVWGAYSAAIMDFLDASPEPPPSRSEPHPIPSDWTPQQALVVADFCDRLNREIWDAYRDPMRGHLDALAGRDARLDGPWQLELPLESERAPIPVATAVVDDEDIPW